MKSLEDNVKKLRKEANSFANEVADSAVMAAKQAHDHPFLNNRPPPRNNGTLNQAVIQPNQKKHPSGPYPNDRLKQRRIGDNAAARFSVAPQAGGAAHGNPPAAGAAPSWLPAKPQFTERPPVVAQSALSHVSTPQDFWRPSPVRSLVTANPKRKFTGLTPSALADVELSLEFQERRQPLEERQKYWELYIQGHFPKDDGLEPLQVSIPSSMVASLKGQPYGKRHVFSLAREQLATTLDLLYLTMHGMFVVKIAIKKRYCKLEAGLSKAVVRDLKQTYAYMYMWSRFVTDDGLQIPLDEFLSTMFNNEHYLLCNMLYPDQMDHFRNIFKSGSSMGVRTALPAVQKKLSEISGLDHTITQAIAQQEEHRRAQLQSMIAGVVIFLGNFKSRDPSDDAMKNDFAQSLVDALVEILPELPLSVKVNMTGEVFEMEGVISQPLKGCPPAPWRKLFSDTLSRLKEALKIGVQ